MCVCVRERERERERVSERERERESFTVVCCLVSLSVDWRSGNQVPVSTCVFFYGFFSGRTFTQGL